MVTLFVMLASLFGGELPASPAPEATQQVSIGPIWLTVIAVSDPLKNEYEVLHPIHGPVIVAGPADLEPGDPILVDI